MTTTGMTEEHRLVTATDLIGQTIGGYRVEALLGSGGMASVYSGLDPRLQRPVAIKVLGGRAAVLPGFDERFRQEARLAASLRHPNVVQIYALGEERGLTYMVQELLPGPTLEQRIADVAGQGGSFSPAEAQAIVAQLAGALDAAHAAGMVHRDVKPANALWNGAGALVLTDFGIAKALGGALTQTQAGVVMGTPAYIAPEQAQGQPLGPATDIYALGVILYELLTGRVPFTAPESLAVLLQHVQDAPAPPRALRPDLPAAVEAVVLRALAKEPGARYASAGALAEALEGAWAAPAAGSVHQVPTRRWEPPAANRGPTAPQPRPAGVPNVAPRVPTPVAAAARRRSTLLPVLGALLALVFAGAAILALRGAPGRAPEQAAVGATAPVVESAPATGEPAPAGPAAEVRALLAEAARDGSAGPQGEALLATLDAAQQALDRGDAAAAAERLAALQRALLAEARADALAPDLLRLALAGVEAIAADHGLSLPLTVSAG